MSVSIRRNAVSVCLFVASLLPAQARAQNWSFDARAVGLGGVGSTSNVAVDSYTRGISSAAATAAIPATSTGMIRNQRRCQTIDGNCATKPPSLAPTTLASSPL